MERDEWLAARRKGIGSSDAAAACGIKSFGRGQLWVYLDKLGLAPPVEETEQMELGSDMEPLVAARYERRTGTRLVNPEGVIYHHAAHPWMLATPDRFTIDHTKAVELKVSWSREGWGPDGTDEVPEGYLLQVQHQLAVLGIEEADLVALVCGELRIYPIQRNEVLVRTMIEIEGELWERIQRRDPPEPDFSHPQTAKLLDLLYRPTEGVEVELDDGETLGWLGTYVLAGEQAAAAEKTRDMAKAHIIARMAGASSARLPDGRTVRRKAIPEKEITYTRKEYFDFRIIQPKKEKVTR